MSDTRKPTLELLLQLAIEARLAELHVSLPCKVISYDAAKQTVDLQPLIKRTRTARDGTTESTDMKSLQKVPVAFPRTSGGWITFPINTGDIGMVTFAERSIKDWMGKSAGEVVEATERTLHPLGGAWFYPGAYPSASPLSGGADDANVVIHTGSKLDLGEKGLNDADNLVALAKLVKAELTAIVSNVNTNYTALTDTLTAITSLLNAAPGPVLSAPGSVPVYVKTNASNPGDVKATKVRAK